MALAQLGPGSHRPRHVSKLREVPFVRMHWPIHPASALAWRRRGLRSRTTPARTARASRSTFIDHDDAPIQSRAGWAGGPMAGRNGPPVRPSRPPAEADARVPNRGLAALTQGASAARGRRGVARGTELA